MRVKVVNNDGFEDIVEVGKTYTIDGNFNCVKHFEEWIWSSDKFIMRECELTETVNSMRFKYANTGDKVMCIDKLIGSSLTVGKIYEIREVVACRGDVIYIEVVNDKGKKVSYASDFFKKVNDDELDVDLSSKYHIHNKKPSKNPLEEKILNENKRKNIDKGNNNPIKPNHYKSGKFDVIAFCFEHELDFALGNVVKYVVRAGKKDSSKELEDLLKAQEYLNREIERVKASE
ncbi:hypothetical protein C672_3661 [[Clostridium] bifermentans ATCC 638]|uniref:Uncharacterized protein n=2 Tax=Paraclostridium bifermentans TaxID=1490 RepID=T4VG95_PARBF|nr:hypothetical protein C672_3661 [[Clostridium] bifermentans ATCC 638] [Paraclostridium bifermentans ATCC 638 = DSM 14991]